MDGVFDLMVLIVVIMMCALISNRWLEMMYDELTIVEFEIEWIFVIESVLSVELVFIVRYLGELDVII